MKQSALFGVSGKKYYDTIRYNYWLLYMFDIKNKKTFRNRTQAAINAYLLDENDPKQYNLASVIGSKNYKKYKDLCLAHLDKKGISFGVVYDIIIANMFKSNNPIWVKIVARILGMSLERYY